MTHFLSDKEIDSVLYLSKIRKAVYLMQNIENKNIYRFGGIGAIDGQVNNPIRRLGQCTHVENQAIQKHWLFASMMVLPHATTGIEIRKIEKTVRDYFFKIPGILKNEQIGGKDAFETVASKKYIINQFKKSIVSN